MPSIDDRQQAVLRRFLADLVCPESDCCADLIPMPSGVVCAGKSIHHYPMEGIPHYLVLSKEPRSGGALGPAPEGPPYADPDYALRYAGLWAFPYTTLINRELAAHGWLVGRGETDSFYRSVTSIAIQALGGRTPEIIWDIGCGVGRVVHDLAGIYPTSAVVGLDNSAAMLSVAARILGSVGDFDIDLSDVGFGTARIRRSIVPCRENTLLVQADAESISVRPHGTKSGADLVLLVNVLDRTLDPDLLLRTAMSAVASNGLIVVAISGSWLTSGLWRRYPDALRFCLKSLSDAGFDVIIAVENLLLRELANSRGATDDYPISVIAASRSANDF